MYKIKLMFRSVPNLTNPYLPSEPVMDLTAPYCNHKQNLNFYRFKPFSAVV